MSRVDRVYSSRHPAVDIDIDGTRYQPRSGGWESYSKQEGSISRWPLAVAGRSGLSLGPQVSKAGGPLPCDVGMSLSDRMRDVRLESKNARSFDQVRGGGSRGGG
jgi:hypothetical protein